MSAARTPKPILIWLASCIAIAALVCGVMLMLDYVRRDALNPVTPLPTLLGLLIGIVGFWLMRWWGVAFAAAASLFVAILATLHGTPTALWIMAAYCLPILIAATLTRRQFRW